MALQRAELTEAYARTRRLFVFRRDREAYNQARANYERTLDELLKTNIEIARDNGQRNANDALEARRQELIDEINNNPEGDRETLMQEANDELARMTQEQQDALNGQLRELFLNEYLSEGRKLREQTIDSLDNGTFFRQAVSKVIANKRLRTGLAIAGAIGLGITAATIIPGIMAGTVAVGFGLTASGVAAGALKGGLSGTLMSRQSSETSAIRGFEANINENAMRDYLGDLDFTKLDRNSGNVASYLLDRYTESRDADRSSNIRKTAISAGIGAAVGAIASGIKINNIGTEPRTRQVPTGKYTERVPDVDVNNINIGEGEGIYRAAEQLGIKPEDLQEAFNIVDARSGGQFVADSNGIKAGVGGEIGQYAHFSPGTFADQLPQQQNHLMEALKVLADQGKIPYHGGQPVMKTITDFVPKVVEDRFRTGIIRNLGAVTAGVGASRINDRAPNATRNYNTEAINARGEFTLNTPTISLSDLNTPNPSTPNNPNGPNPTGPNGPTPTTPNGPNPTNPNGPNPTNPNGPNPTGPNGPNPNGPNPTGPNGPNPNGPNPTNPNGPNPTGPNTNSPNPGGQNVVRSDNTLHDQVDRNQNNEDAERARAQDWWDNRVSPEDKQLYSAVRIFLASHNIDINSGDGQSDNNSNGGDDRTTTSSNLPPAEEARIQEWWSNLSNDQRQQFLELCRRLDSFNLH